MLVDHVLTHVAGNLHHHFLHNLRAVPQNLHVGQGLPNPEGLAVFARALPPRHHEVSRGEALGASRLPRALHAPEDAPIFDAVLPGAPVQPRARRPRLLFLLQLQHDPLPLEVPLLAFRQLLPALCLCIFPRTSRRDFEVQPPPLGVPQLPAQALLSPNYFHLGRALRLQLLLLLFHHVDGRDTR